MRTKKNFDYYQPGAIGRLSGRLSYHGNLTPQWKLQYTRLPPALSSKLYLSIFHSSLITHLHFSEMPKTPTCVSWAKLRFMVYQVLEIKDDFITVSEVACLSTNADVAYSQIFLKIETFWNALSKRQISEITL
jgi:hypothetical protein